MRIPHQFCISGNKKRTKNHEGLFLLLFFYLHAQSTCAIEQKTHVKVHGFFVSSFNRSNMYFLYIYFTYSPFLGNWMIAEVNCLKNSIQNLSRILIRFPLILWIEFWAYKEMTAEFVVRKAKKNPYCEQNSAHIRKEYA